MSDKSFQLIVRRGPKPGQTFPLVGPSISIGRDPMSDITLSDPEVSRYHAQLTQVESGYQIQDMGSTNGTYIDDDRLTGDPRVLHPGQAVQLGSGVILEYQMVGVESNLMSTLVDDSAIPPPPRRAAAIADPTEVSDFSDLPPLPEFDDEYVAPPSMPRYAPEQSYAPVSPPSSAPPPPPPIPVAAPNAGDGKRRRTIIIVLIVLLLLCCCAVLVSGYFVWGDPLLELLCNEGSICL